MKLPELKKRIHSFLTKEDGNVSKEKLVKAGVVIGIATLASAKDSKAVCSASHSNSCPPHGNSDTHCNELTSTYAGASLSGTHSHHGNHCSHASHASHSSHGQW